MKELIGACGVKFILSWDSGFIIHIIGMETCTEFTIGVCGLGDLKESLICLKLSVDKLTKVWYNVSVKR